jgi:Response regulator of the LytR/AlgR family
MINSPIRAIIVEDEPHNRENLHTLLADFCPSIEVIGLCASASEGRQQIIENRPDLVFLDVEMPGGDGFSLLESLPSCDFEVIFVTAFSNYAIKAIKFSALDYIVKPIDVKELVKAVDKAVVTIRNSRNNFRMQNLLDNKYRKDDKKIIALPLSDKIEFVEIADIIRCEADGNYTFFHLKNGERLLISKTLKEYDELLSHLNFLRVHQSHLINLNEVKSFVKTDGGYILMKDGSNVSISRQRREMVLGILHKNKS